MIDSVLYSEKYWSCREYPGEEETLPTWIVLTVKDEIRALSTSADKGRRSSITPRARQAGVPRITQFSLWTMQDH